MRVGIEVIFERAGQRTLGLGIDLAEDDVRVSLRGLLEDRTEGPARRAPSSPEVEKDDALFRDDIFEAVSGDLSCSHALIVYP